MSKQNALAKEKSPYLLQHANNPVDWLPWGEAAFEKARNEDRPVLVSIGYSTCHWCHVMERESFENEEIAALLNEAFVCVKVDREERPDVDATYMNVCQMLTGSGGWPLNVLVTADKKPFFAATYLPPTAKGGRMGLTELIPRIMEIWNHERERVTDSSEKITNALAEMKPSDETGEAPDSGRLARLAHGALGSMFDTDSGGFGKAPKFPSAQNLLFLLQYAWRHDNADARDMAVNTLRAMRRGGIWDHVGFGFHRYSTDKHWLLPHFEKMLYDQAMLSMALIEAHQATGDPEFAETARRIFTYVLRDLRDPQGGFHTAEDADSEGEEGLFHTWTTAEIGEVLSPEETERFCEHYGIRSDGNFRDEATGQYTGRNIPNELESGKPASPDVEFLRERLFEAREKRPRPHLDDKVLTDMNGLMIAALARGARVLGDSEYLTAAREAADFILGTLREEDGRMRHGYRDGHLNAPGTLDDHAFILWGLSELYEATFDSRYLNQAESIAQAMIRHFEDPDAGGFFLSADDGETVLMRHKDSYDGAIPCGNSVAVHSLTALGRLLERPDFEDAATRCAAAHSGIMNGQPIALTHMVAGLETLQAAPTTVTVVGPKEAPETLGLLDTANSAYHPGLVVRFLQTDTEIPDTTDYESELGKLNAVAGAWLCRNYHCEPPTSDPQKLMEMLT